MQLAEFRILTVCTGNVHRSAFGAEMLRTWAGWYLPTGVAGNVVVTSAGTRAALGASMDPSLLAMLSTLGGDGKSHRARQIREDDIIAADLVLAASREHRDVVLSLVPSAMRRTFTIREAGRVARLLHAHPERDHDALETFVATLADRRHQAASITGTDDDIVDPEGQGKAAFARMAGEEIPALVAVAVAAFGMPSADAEAYLAAIGSSAELDNSVP